MNKIEILKLIQSELFRVKTIETQGKDNLDEHLVHIETLVLLVQRAFDQGKNSVLNCRHWDVVPRTRSVEYGDIVEGE